MGVSKIDVSELHMGFMNKGSWDRTVYRKMALLINCCWDYIMSLLVLVYRAAGLHIFRIRKNDGLSEDDSSVLVDDDSTKDSSGVLPIEDSKELVPLVNISEMEDKDCRLFSEEEPSKFFFKFQYQFPADTMSAIVEQANPVTDEGALSKTAEISKYCFLPKKDFSGFIEEPGTMTLCVQESYAKGTGDEVPGKQNLNTEISTGFLSAKGLQEISGLSHSNMSSKDDMLLKNKLLKEESTIVPENYSFVEKDSGSFFEEQEKMIVPSQFYVEEKIDMSANDCAQSNVFRNLDNLTTDMFQLDNTVWDQVPLGSKTGSLDEKDSGSILEEPEAMKFWVRDPNSDNIDYEEKLDTEITEEFLLSNNFRQSNTSKQPIKQKQPKYASLEVAFVEQDLHTRSEKSSVDKNEALNGVRFLSHSSSNSDSDTESGSISYSVQDLPVDPDSDGFLSESDFDKDGQPEDLKEFDCKQQLLYSSSTYYDDSREGHVYNKKQPIYEEMDKGFPSKREFSEKIRMSWSSAYEREFTESSDDQGSSFRTDSNRLSFSDDSFVDNKYFAGEDSGPLSELQFSKTDHLHSLRRSSTEFDHSTGGITAPPDNSEQNQQLDASLLQRDRDLVCNQDDLPSKESSPERNIKKFKETIVQDLDTKDSDELESLWEHQFLIEQLKMELRKVKAIGLPTIFEESESPKASEDLKPWKIDENLFRENSMDELQKLYKSYRERMRKFDILNYQKMYAIGFLRLKDPLQSIGSQKPRVPTIMAQLSGSFWPFCRPKLNSDPSQNFLKELQSDLETVYVGQTCLSWEFLRWQYEKTHSLPESDPYRSHQYNEVAGEFQQFQVIIQRYIENESFQGPRLPNYVKNRCVLRNLIQVPVIKEDGLKDNMDKHKKGDGAITSELLDDIMEESIRTFWEFVKADKNETPVILKGFIESHVELQDPSDSELFKDVQALLQKRDKKLKDIVRSGNCLVKKFKKPQEGRVSQDVLFCQVELKLVSMVLTMSRISTEQLLWCHKKLNNITIQDRKVRREPSFLLFPC